ncbi:MAG: hypothetical protein WAT79_00105 [Saprospiraceae bacterium]
MEHSLKPTQPIQQTTECPNCGFLDHGEYCSDCGGLLKPYKISLSTLFTTIIEWEDRVSNTTKELFLRPIPFIKAYIGGSRSRTAVPLKYLIFCFGVYVFVYQFFAIDSLYVNDIELQASQMLQLENEMVLENFLGSYGKFFNLLFIPFYAVLAKLFYQKSAYNMVEKATAMTFLLGFLMVLETGLSLATALMNPLFFIKNFLILLAEWYIFFILSFQLYKDKWYHAAWKSLTLLFLSLTCMEGVIMLVDQVLQLYYN